MLRLNRAMLPLVSLLACACLLHFFSLMRTPAPAIDEAWNANRAVAFLHTGRAFGSLDQGVFQKFDGYWTYFPWLAAFIHAGFVGLFGASLFSVRLASLFFGLLLLVAAYIIGRELGGKRTGLLAILVVALSDAFVYSAHLARHDIIVAAMGYGGIALYLTDKTPRSKLSFRSLLMGLQVGLTLDIHPNGMIYWAAIGALFLFDYGWSTFRSLRFWSFMLGIAGGVAFFVAMHILPYGATYSAIGRLGGVGSRTPPLLTGDPAILFDSFSYTLYQINLLVNVLVVAAFVLLLRRGKIGDKKLLVIYSVVLVAFAAIVRNKAFHYAIYISPAASLLVAALLDQALGAIKGTTFVRKLSGTLAWAVAAAAFLFALMPLQNQPMLDYDSTVQSLQKSIPPGKSVIGTQTYWFGLSDRPYYSWDQAVYYQQYAPGSTLDDAYRQLRPDYLILDSELQTHFIDPGVELPKYQWYLHLPRTQLTDFLNKRATLVSQTDSAIYGKVLVYKLNWN